jgi:hypothetical protein
MMEVIDLTDDDYMLVDFVVLLHIVCFFVTYVPLPHRKK